MPCFSVVIPLFNKENYIEATLKSVLAQTFTDFEIVIVDDVSTDNSLQAAQKVPDARVRIIGHPVNKGLSAARNTGIRSAQSPYIAFLDADDSWKPNFLQAIHELISSYPEASVFATKYQEVHPGGVVLEHEFPVASGIISNFFLSNLNQSLYNFSCVCIKKEAIEAAGFFDESINYAEDVDFNIRLHLNHTMAYRNSALACYNIHSENQITRGSTAGKTITDFDKYERLHPDRADLKKYLDFKRYIMAKHYRMEGAKSAYTGMVNAIDPGNLTGSQKILLHAPAPVLFFIRRLKKMLLKIGVNPTTY